MDFGEFWVRLALRVGCGAKKFSVLTQASEFKTEMTEPNGIIVSLTSKGWIFASKKEFRKVWDIAKHGPRDRRYVSIGGRYRCIFAKSYICALIDYIVKELPGNCAGCNSPHWNRPRRRPSKE